MELDKRNGENTTCKGNTGKPERTTGADFYLVIKEHSQTKRYLIQAKKMYPGNKDILQNRYRQLTHKVKVKGVLKDQFKIFRQYCSNLKFEALYCFYNSIFEQKFEPVNQIKKT